MELGVPPPHPQTSCSELFRVLPVSHRVSAVYNSVRGSCSDAGFFTTHCSVPDVPLSPKLTHRTKSTLSLQWKVGAGPRGWLGGGL